MKTQSPSLKSVYSNISSTLLVLILAFNTVGCSGLFDLDWLESECSSLNPDCEPPIIEPTEPMECVDGDFYYDEWDECYCETGEWVCMEIGVPHHEECDLDGICEDWEFMPYDHEDHFEDEEDEDLILEDVDEEENAFEENEDEDEEDELCEEEDEDEMEEDEEETWSAWR